MDPDLAGIFMFILAILFVVLPFAYLINKRVQDHEERKLELEARIEEARAAQGQARNESYDLLEDRMRVIERIVTDPSTDLSIQIDGLRADREKVQ